MFEAQEKRVHSYLRSSMMAWLSHFKSETQGNESKQGFGGIKQILRRTHTLGVLTTLLAGETQGGGA